MVRTVREEGSPDLAVFIVTIALLTIGLIMVFSSSSPMALDEFGDAYFYLKRQLFWAALGVIAMIVMLNVDYHLLWKLVVPAYAGVLVLLVIVLVPGIGKLVGGSRRWIPLGGIANIQPSELAKIAVVLMMSAYLTRIDSDVNKLITGILIPLALTSVFCLLILLEPDLGTAIAVAAVCFIMLFMGGARVIHLLMLVPPVGAAVVWLIYNEPYRFRRLMAFIDPWADPLDTGYHIIQSLLALGSGGLLGLGLGMSRQKFDYLPETHTDFIFSVLGEELGFVGTVTVVCLFFVFAWRGLRAAILAPDHFGRLLCAGLTMMIVFQALMNIGVVTASIPVTGISLPLISSGGSSLTITLASIGVIMNVSRHSQS